MDLLPESNEHIQNIRQIAQMSNYLQKVVKLLDQKLMSK